jgi:hypothetical protein
MVSETIHPPSNSGMGRAELEWQMTLQVAQHFNDLLMRLRSFGLPLLVTVMGLGVGLSFKYEIREVPGWATLAIVTANCLVVVPLTVLTSIRPGWGNPPKNWREGHASDLPDGSLEFVERLMWACPPILAFITFLYFTCRVGNNLSLLERHVTYSGSLPVLLFGLGLLLVLYTLDRFYYYKLLLGAVCRATEIESGFGIELTSRISSLINSSQSAAVVTFIYFIPGLIGYFVALALLLFHPSLNVVS